MLEDIHSFFHCSNRLWKDIHVEVSFDDLCGYWMALSVVNASLEKNIICTCRTIFDTKNEPCLLVDANHVLRVVSP